ncbi:MAG: CvpA family protein [Chloroflexi bacterium]|nr:CvpA family protein [Chloroflexota bacterium]
MNWLDLVFTGIILAVAYVSHGRGTLRSLFALIGIAGGIWFSGRVSPGLADLLSAFVKDENDAAVLAFILVVIVVGLLLNALGNIILGMLSLHVEGVPDRVGGLVIGIAMGLLITQLMLTLLLRFPVDVSLSEGVKHSSLQASLVPAHWNAALWLADTDANAIGDLFRPQGS